MMHNKMTDCACSPARRSTSFVTPPQVLMVSSAVRALQNATGTAAPSQLYTLQVRTVQQVGMAQLEETCYCLP